MIKNHTKTIFRTLDISQLKKLMTIKSFSVNPLYLRVNHAGGYIEEKGVNKCLFFDSKDQNRGLIKK